MSLRVEASLREFEQAARRYCTILETDPVDRDKWLADVLGSLASLYACAHRLPDYGLPEKIIEPPESLDVSGEEIGRIAKRIGEFLGEHSMYWTYFDVTITNDPTEKPVAGALWDDLADIYRDVKPGLKAWDTGKDEYLHSVAFEWRYPLFEVHWGLHAVDAMRALHQLTFLHGIKTGN